MLKRRTISAVGERNLIAHFQKKLQNYKYLQKPFIDIGDDAFVAGLTSSSMMVVSTDALVSDIHFSNRYMSYREIGRKAMMVNLSDLAAMGWVKPLYALISCSLPKNFSFRDCDELFNGLSSAAYSYGVRIVGGDTVASPKPIFISITVIGEAKRKHIVTRSGAKKGDVIFSSGPLGFSYLGLILLSNSKNKHKLSKNTQKLLIKRHVNPEPKFELAEILAKNKLATSLIDSSDGLQVSIREITRSSNVGARLDITQLVENPVIKSVCAKLKVDPVKICAGGGEDYELIFTVPRHKAAFVRKKVASAIEVGEISAPDAGVSYNLGVIRVSPEVDFKHF
ncbi:MAG: thiamine-phosphate kinase [bacterium]